MTVKKSIVLQDSDIKDAIFIYLESKGVDVTNFTHDDIEFEIKENGVWEGVERIHATIDHEDEI